MQPTFKACPRCGAPAPLDAAYCQRAGCGHQFRTQFVQPDRTQLLPPPQAYQPPPPQQAFGPSTPPRRSIVLVLGLSTLLLVMVATAAFLATRRSVPTESASTNEAMGGGSLMSSGPFKELPSEQETPTVEVLNQDWGTMFQNNADLVFRSEREYRLGIAGPRVSITIPAGTYQYELRGRRYQQTGEPDQRGTFTCRRYRRYELFMFTGPRRMNTDEDLGDGTEGVPTVPPLGPR